MSQSSHLLEFGGMRALKRLVPGGCSQRSVARENVWFPTARGSTVSRCQVGVSNFAVSSNRIREREV